MTYRIDVSDDANVSGLTDRIISDRVRSMADGRMPQADRRNLVSRREGCRRSRKTSWSHHTATVDDSFELSIQYEN